MKPKIKGDAATLAALYEERHYIRRKDRHGGQFVEYVKRVGDRYDIEICGINGNGVECRGSNTERGYFWQIADTKAVADVLENPENAYNYICVCNGLLRKD